MTAIDLTIEQLAAGQFSHKRFAEAAQGFLAHIPLAGARGTFPSTPGSALDTAVTACAGLDPVLCGAEFFRKMVNSLSAEDLYEFSVPSDIRLPELKAVTISPASVVGAAGSTGTLHLSRPAPAGGCLVTLASDDTDVSTVPANATVLEGHDTVTFVVTTKTQPGVATITGTYDSHAATATITVTA
jgi:hypothetical protein